MLGESFKPFLPGEWDLFWLEHAKFRTQGHYDLVMPAVFCRARDEIEWGQDVLFPGRAPRIVDRGGNDPLQVALPLKDDIATVPQPTKLRKCELAEFAIGQCEIKPRNRPVFLPVAGIVF